MNHGELRGHDSFHPAKITTRHIWNLEVYVCAPLDPTVPGRWINGCGFRFSTRNLQVRTDRVTEMVELWSMMLDMILRVLITLNAVMERLVVVS